MAKLDSSLPVYDLKTLENQLDETLSTERLIASCRRCSACLRRYWLRLGFMA